MELFLLGAMWSRDALAAGLGRVVASTAIDEPTALRRGELILAGHARRLFGWAV